MGDFEQIADELAVLVTREHDRRTRAERIAEELSVLLAHERAAREKAEQEADAAIARAELEASWRRRFKAADRRRRREMLGL